MASAPSDAVVEFHAGATTHLVAGSGLVDRVGDWAATFGRRALLVVGESHARESGLLARTQGALAAAGLDVELLEGVGPNPSVAVVDTGAMLARARRSEVVVALGGGSVIDAAKAIATSAAAATPRSFADHLSGRRSSDLLVDSVLPVVAMPTLPGSGSETNGTSVITDDETGRKLSAHSDLAAPRIALLDPQLLDDVAPELLGPGLVDGFCHALEAGLSRRASIASDALAEQAIRMLLREDRSVLDEDLAPGARRLARMRAWWATNLAGQALTLAGSIVTHPLAHPVSARFDARHGEAVAALEGAVIAVLGDQLAETDQLTRVASWMDVRSAARHDAALHGVLQKLTRVCTRMRVRASLTDLGVDEHAVSLLVRDARESGSRGLGNSPGGEPDVALLFRIADVARRVGPTDGARALQDAAAQAAATASVLAPDS